MLLKLIALLNFLLGIYILLKLSICAYV